MSPHRPTPADLDALVEELITIDSVNPDLVPGAAGEGEIALLVGGWLAERGVAVRYQDAAPGRLNVIGRVAGHGGGRSLMLNAHLDTVGTATMPDALQPVIDGGRLYGRGAHDTKAALATPEPHRTSHLTSETPPSVFRCSNPPLR